MNNDIQRALSALHAIPNDLHREIWHKVGIAAIAAGLSIDDIVAWSEPGYDKFNERDVRAAFKNINPGGGITERTLFKIARDEYQWIDDGKIHAPEKKPSKPVKPATEPRKQAPGMNALSIWERCEKVPFSHEYAVRKRLSDTTLKILRVVPPGLNDVFYGKCAGYLAVPMYAPDGTLQTLQLIPEEHGATKLNLYDIPKKGATLRLGDNVNTPLIFTESIANADSLWLSAGYQAVCCFGSGNIKTAVADYRSREPGRDFIIMPDKGKESEAWDIAAEFNCAVAVLPDTVPDKSDINDLYCAGDSDIYVVQDILGNATKPPEPDYPVSLVFADELSTNYEPPDELIEGVITAGAGSVLYGDSNSGKTFLAIDMACSVARGVDWQGRKVEAGAVVYIASESPGSVRGRLQAYQQHHGCTVPNFAIVQSSINLYRDDIDTNRIIVLVRQIERQRGVKVRLIVGDTLARLSTGANENSGEMGQVIERFDRIRTECNSHFMLIHHSGKNAANGARGWSGIRAAIDTELEVTDNPTGRCCEVMKQRDLQSKGERIGFRLDSVTLGVTKWGKPATSCVVVASDAPEKKTGKRMGEVEGAVVEFLAAHKVGIKRSEVSKHFEGRYQRPSVSRAIKSLVTAGAVHEAAGMVCIAVAAK